MHKKGPGNYRGTISLFMLPLQLLQLLCMLPFHRNYHQIITDSESAVLYDGPIPENYSNVSGSYKFAENAGGFMTAEEYTDALVRILV